ncbi:NUDIX hydrolase [Myxococcota bacterium]|nr:NUDIX hydrolase [Myxococcota bacterium]
MTTPALTDLAYQRFYRTAYKLMKVYWAAARPKTHGALVALWHGGRVLLVRQSYLDYHSLPGGYVKRGETAKQAAVRELREELGLTTTEDRLALVLDVTHEWNQHLDHVEVFALELDEPPVVTVDHREVVDARFYTVEEALALDLFPPLRAVLKRRPRPNG